MSYCLKILLAGSLALIGLVLLSCSYEVVTPIKTSSGTRGVVSSAHPLATQAGIEILKNGGNAMDAAIATAYALSVVYPRAGNLGGGGFMLFRSSDGEIDALDFRERAPLNAHRDMYLNDEGEVIHGLSLSGPLAIGTPGTVAGLSDAHKKYGTLPLSVIMAPAIQYARRGFRISDREARKLNKHLDDFKMWNTLNIPFIKDHWKVGDVLKQRSLASTLEKIANHGKDYFYASDLSDSLVTHIQDLGGIISKTDLESYTSVWREPLSKSYKGFDVHSMPLPSSGGIVLSQILETLDNYDLTSPLHPKDIHLMVEAERRAYADRAAYLGDPAYIKVPIDKLLDPVYIDERMSSFSWQRATDSDSVYTGDFSIEKEGFETTHLSVVDKDGNAVALTTTLNSNYGSKIFFPYGGFFLNNEMDDFSVKPGIPNQFGLIGNEANAIEAGKRMLSSMTPTIVEKDGEFFMALGTPGGSTIITSVLQVFLNVVEYDLSLEESIALPRFHHQWLPDIIFYEPALPDSIRMHLKQMGHLFKEKDYIGFVDAVMRMPDGRLIGGADPRGDDHTSGY